VENSQVEIKEFKNPVFSCEIPGRPISKKNTKKVVKRHGLSLVIYSPQFRQWERDALLILKRLAQGRELLTCKLEAHFVFKFVNHRSEADVSNLIEAPQDALEKACIIKNDRLIHVVRARKEFGFLQDSTVIELYKLED
jgi:Holliday junction resolvase RusA-like endonuclease